ncbi:MAG: endonuclease [Eubacteriales bacterium]|nr:endonuclease [Eubacteriales bacterium]
MLQIWKRRCRAMGVVLLAVLGMAAAGLLLLTVREYRPKAVQDAKEMGNQAKQSVAVGDTVTVLSFNTGYAAQDKYHDSKLDGGKNKVPKSRKMVEENVRGISEILRREDTDVVFLQEVDKDSRRSFYVDESRCYASLLKERQSFYATNYQCDMIASPWPVVGRVKAGLMTLSRFEASQAERVSLPEAKRWPQKLFSLKRCLLVTRIPLANSERELVLINLHLDAYGDGNNRAAQTEFLYDMLNWEYAAGNYCIAGGDFNQMFENVPEDLYPLKITKHFLPGLLTYEGLIGEWVMANDPSVPTSRLLNEPYDPESENTQHYVIDGYLVSPNIKVEQVETLDEGFAYTDHNPVKLQVRLLEEENQWFLEEEPEKNK